MAHDVSQADPGMQKSDPSSFWSKIVWIVWLLLFLGGIVGVVQRLLHGHLPTGYGSYVPWGLWIGLYFLGVGISGGSFVIGSVGYLLGVNGFSKPEELRMAIVLSVAAILPAFIGVTLDLGHPERLFYILMYPTFTSMMAFNAWMYNVFIGVAILTWLLTYKKHTMWLKPLLVVGSFFSILFPSQSGVFFEAVRTNQFWHSPILSVLFLASAFALGAAGLILIQPMRDMHNRTFQADEAMTRLRIVAIGAIIVYLMFEFAEFSIVFWNPGEHSPNAEFLLFGGYWSVFWILHLLLGALVPLLLFLRASRAGWIVGSVLALIGFAAARMCVLVPGQIAGQIPGLAEAFQDVRLTYTYQATTTEYLVGCFMVSVGMAILYVGMRLSRTLESATAQET